MSRKLLAGTVLLGVGVLTVVFGLSSPKPIYARSVSAFLAQPVREQPVRVQGVVVPRSLCRESQGCGYRFRLADWSALGDEHPIDSSPQLSVHYPQCIVPDSFREIPGQIFDITVEGELCANCHRFEASQIFAKCPAVYRLKRDGESCSAGTTKTPLCTARWPDR